jgi:hypothetical protein
MSHQPDDGIIARVAVTPVDARAKQILFDAYWTSKGWLDEHSRNTSPEDRGYAIEHGLMFEPLTIEHDDLVERVRSAAAALRPRDVADAFVASLSARRPDLRSGLASYALAAKLEPHAFQADINGVWCEVCRGVRRHVDEDVSVLSFERHKWGGVRHDQPIYQYVDLTALRAALPAKPEPADRAMFARVLREIERTPKPDGPTKLSLRLKDIVPSDKNERNALLEILGAADVLVPRAERSSPGEWSFVGMWRGADGYDKAAVKRIFGTAAAKPTSKRASSAATTKPKRTSKRRPNA